MSENNGAFYYILNFLKAESGKKYISPAKAGEREQEMKQLASSGTHARNLFIEFARRIVDGIPDLKYISCSNWVNQGQRIMPYFWIEFKNPKWEQYPNSISMSVSNGTREGLDNYILSIRVDTRNIASSESDYARQAKLLDLDLKTDMVYQVMHKNGSYSFYTKDDRELLKNKKAAGELTKIEVNYLIDNLIDCEESGVLFDRARSSIENLIPYYKYIMSSEDENSTEWGPSLDEYNPGITVQMYKDVLTNENVVKRHWLRTLYQMYQYGGVATCKQLSVKYGMTPNIIRNYLTTAAQKIGQYYNVPLYEENGHGWLWTTIFTGKHADKETEGTYVWKMRDPLMTAIKELDAEEKLNILLEGSENMPNNTIMPLNQILYGPPGTGKTYNTVLYAVSICDGISVSELKKKSYLEVLDRYNQLKKEKRIAFVTFHQSYGYEEFIEGIKPTVGEDSEVRYSVEDGIFKRMCNLARDMKIQAHSGEVVSGDAKIWGMMLGGRGKTAIKKYCFDNNCIRIGFSEVKDDEIENNPNITAKTRNSLYQFSTEMQIGDLVLIENTYHSIDAVGVVTGDYEYLEEESQYFPRKRTVEWLFKDKEIQILPYLPSDRKTLARFTIFNFSYLGLDKVSEILAEAGVNSVEVEEETKPYVFVIDEINRGNISKIFGELITLIEETKRSGAGEAMEAILPYSGMPFSVPNNLYILGTMNTADRSIALMDTALRRRFSFIEMMPDSQILKDLNIGTITVDGVEINIARMLDVINERISYLYDREHMIGHAFFTKLVENSSLETLADIFKTNVIPLLQEYFYEDYEKIQLVLGDNAKTSDDYKFILDREVKTNQVFKGDVDIDLIPKQYEIQEEAFFNIESYKEIGDGI